MKVFLIWSGHDSKVVASALKSWLPDVLQNVEVWMSEHDIKAGMRWGDELGKQLENSNFGIICLTSENLSSPWLLFEAGSLAKAVESSRVVPYRIDVGTRDVKFPLAQFQSVAADKKGTLKLLESINEAMEVPMSRHKLHRLFQKWWPDLSHQVDLPVQTALQDDIAVLTPAGTLMGGPNTTVLYDKVLDTIGNGYKKIILDLRDVTRMNSIFCGMLVSALTHVHNNGGRLVLSGLQDKLLSFLAMIKMAVVFEVFDTLEEAIEYLKNDS